jgi:hypothetical protein
VPNRSYRAKGDDASVARWATDRQSSWLPCPIADPFSSERRQGSTVKNRVFSAATHFRLDYPSEG